MIYTSSLSIADAAINGRFVAVGRGRMVTSKAYRGFKDNFAAQVRDESRPPLHGPVFVTLQLPYMRTCQQEHNIGIPFGDVDSPIKCILDALKLGGAYVDDSQVVGLLATKWPRPEQLICEVLPWAM